MISIVDVGARHGRQVRRPGLRRLQGPRRDRPDTEIITDTLVSPGHAERRRASPRSSSGTSVTSEKPTRKYATHVYGDAAYGAGEFLNDCAEAGNRRASVKTPPPNTPAGLFTKDAFRMNLGSDTVACRPG